MTSVPLRFLPPTVLLVGACTAGRVAPADDDAPPPGGALQDLAVRIDGRPLDCARVVVRRVGASPLLEARGGADVRASLDGAPIDLEAEDGLASRATLTLAPGAPARLEVRALLGGEERGRCVSFLRHAPAEDVALELLDEQSETPSVHTRSDDTGAIGELVVRAPLVGETVDDKAAFFLDAYARAFGVTREQLREVDRRVAADGWEQRIYEQRIGARRVFGAFLTLSFDATPALRGAHSSLVPGLSAPGAPVSSAAAVAARASEALGALAAEELELVVYDEVALRQRGAPGARLGWWADGPRGAALYDDATGEAVTSRGAVQFSTHVELHDANLLDPTLPTIACDPFGLVCEVNFMGSSVFLEGASDAAAPTVVDPSVRHPLAEALWRQLGEASEFTEAELGLVGWAPYAIHPLKPQRLGPLAGGTVRALVDAQWGDNAAYVASLRTLIFDDESFVQDPDVICHELAHAVEAEVGPANGVGPRARQFDDGSLGEMVADVYAIYCEAALDPSRDPWLIADVGVDGPVRFIATAHDRGAAGGYRHFDEYRGSGDDDLYRPTFLVTRALHRAVTAHGMALDRARPIAVQTPGWNDLTSYPEVRDRWLATMQSWAQDGRFGVSAEDVCAMARGFRDTGLDGEYGATFAGEGADPATGVTTPDGLICTEERCPPCGDALEEEPPLCEESALAGPTCTNAYGEAICVDAVSDVSTDCPEVGGVQSVRSCICVPAAVEGRAPRWGHCAPSCRVPSEAALPAEELPPNSTGGGGSRDGCAAAPAGAAPPWGLLAGLAALVALGRRRRSCAA